MYLAIGTSCMGLMLKQCNKLFIIFLFTFQINPAVFPMDRATKWYAVLFHWATESNVKKIRKYGRTNNDDEFSSRKRFSICSRRKLFRVQSILSDLSFRILFIPFFYFSNNSLSVNGTCETHKNRKMIISFRLVSFSRVRFVYLCNSEDKEKKNNFFSLPSVGNVKCTIASLTSFRNSENSKFIKKFRRAQ